MAFLNSALGIGLLTTISVSVLTPAPTYACKAYEQHAARAERIGRLRIEIAGRLLQFKTGMKPLIEDREAGFKARRRKGGNGCETSCFRFAAARNGRASFRSSRSFRNSKIGTSSH